MNRFRRAVGGHGKRLIGDPALWVTFGIVAVAAFLLGDDRIRTVSGLVGSAQAQVGTALLGVVVAGLAIFAVFLDEEYVALLDAEPPGPDADIAPFIITGFVAALSAALGIALIIVGAIPPASTGLWVRLGISGPSLLAAVFLVSLWSFLYLLWHTFDLVVFLMGHARVRIALLRRRRRNRDITEALRHRDT